MGALRILIYRLVGRVGGMDPLLWGWMGRLGIVSSPVVVFLRFWVFWGLREGKWEMDANAM